MGIVLNVVLFAIVAGFAFMVIRDYRKQEGSVWSRLCASVKHSATLAWGYVLTGSGFLLSLAAQASDALNAPEVSAFIQAQLSPKVVGIAMLVIGAVTVLARLRTLWRQDV